jgi:hypothetical protein
LCQLKECEVNTDCDITEFCDQTDFTCYQEICSTAASGCRSNLCSDDLDPELGLTADECIECTYHEECYFEEYEVFYERMDQGMSYDDSIAYAAEKGGELLTLDEAVLEMNGNALYPGEDQWAAV